MASSRWMYLVTLVAFVLLAAPVCKNSGSGDCFELGEACSVTGDCCDSSGGETFCMAISEGVRTCRKPPSACAPPEGACKTDFDCCGGLTLAEGTCSAGGVCRCIQDNSSEPCDEDADCCEGSCSAGTCIAASTCCSGHATPGCNDSACETAVCAELPACCSGDWSDACATAARSACGTLCSSGVPTAHFEWTVNGQAPGIGCPSGSTVTINATVSPIPTMAFVMSAACTDGMLDFVGIPTGEWFFEANLLDGTPLGPGVQAIQMTIVEDTTSATLDFVFP